MIVNKEKYIKRMSDNSNKLYASVLIDKLKLPDASTIIDYGCGGGSLTVHLARMYPQYVFIGLDHSEEMIEFASKRSLSNLTFALETDELADVIIMSSVLHEMADGQPDYVKEVLEKVACNLKPNGHIIIREGLGGTTSSVCYPLVDDEEAKRFLKVIRQGKFGNDFTNTLRITNGELIGVDWAAREFLNKYTWGWDSLPREMDEFVTFMTLEHWDNDYWVPDNMEVVSFETTKAQDYFNYLRKLIDLEEDEEWDTHVWAVLKGESMNLNKYKLDEEKVRVKITVSYERVSSKAFRLERVENVFYHLCYQHEIGEIIKQIQQRYLPYKTYSMQITYKVAAE